MNKIVVVYNTDIVFGPSTRHIVTYHEYTCEEDFWCWYYKEFTPLDGDALKVFDTMSDAIAFSRKLTN